MHTAHFLKSRVGIAGIVTAVILLALALSEVAKWAPATFEDDFNVYLTAAQLVREHKTVAIYNSADTGVDPQIRLAPPASLFQQTASSLGIGRIRLYVYPPTLADILVPFTFLSLRHATIAWMLFNTLTILLVAVLALSFFRPLRFSTACIGLFIAALCFRSNIWAIEGGQISCLLFLLWTAGILSYFKGHPRTSAAIFALAVGIKLTPLLVVVPMLLWRDWKWMRFFSLYLATIFFLLCVINGPQTLFDFALHVAPPMSKGFAANANISLPTQLPGLYWACTRLAMRAGLARNFFHSQKAVPVIVLVVAKLITTTIVLTVASFIYKLGPLRDRMDRAKILAMIALISLYCSPVAWQSAYGVAFLVAFFLWADAYQYGASTAELLLLVFCTLEFSFLFDTLLLHFARGVVLNVGALIAPISGCVLIFYSLMKMRHSKELAAAREGLSPAVKAVSFS